MDYSHVVFDGLLLLFLLVVVTLLAKPLGGYIVAVYEGKRTLFSPLISPFEKLFYKLAKINEEDEMSWKQYALSMLIFNFFGIVILFFMLIFQGLFPLNPNGFGGLSRSLALNTAVSFVTNTNWQAYSGESALSYFSQTAGLMVQHFLSAATGMAILIALIRGFTRKTTKTIGNFWLDLVRGVLYILLPISFAAALFLVSQGVIQNFSPYVKATFIEPATDAQGRAVNEQILPMGPVACQEAIKEAGTNGGGFFGANSAHPFENPTPISNIFEIFLILLIPVSLTNTFERMSGNKKEGRALYIAMMFIFVAAVGMLYWAEYSGNALLLKSAAINAPNMEGKETRFRLGESVLFVATTTATSCGSVNTMHDSLTPLGGLVPMFLMLLGEVVFGGVGCGLYTMLAFVILAVFTAGLMIGRTPEYIGKKVEVREMWMSVITVLTPGVFILIFTAIAVTTATGASSILNPGAHGLSEILYAFASASNNNGSAFGGLNTNTVFYNVATAIAMLGGRFIPAVAIIAMAGSLAEKKYTPPSAGTLRTKQFSFILWLITIIIIIGALTFFPAISLGPIAEHLLMKGGM